jgi:hypothetical protein
MSLRNCAMFLKIIILIVKSMGNLMNLFLPYLEY